MFIHAKVNYHFMNAFSAGSSQVAILVPMIRYYVHTIIYLIINKVKKVEFFSYDML